MQCEMEEIGNCLTNLKPKTERLERPEKEEAGIMGKAEEKVSLREKICRERKAGGQTARWGFRKICRKKGMRRSDAMVSCLEGFEIKRREGAGQRAYNTASR